MIERKKRETTRAAYKIFEGIFFSFFLIKLSRFYDKNQRLLKDFYYFTQGTRQTL